MSSAWTVKEWTEAGKRRREKVATGTRGVKESDRFVVEWLDPDNKRFREKIKEPGRVGKRLADDRCARLNGELALGTYEAKNRSSWQAVKERYIRDVLPTKRSEATRREILRTLDRFEKLIRPTRMEAITTATIDAFKAKRLAEKTGKETAMRSTTVNKDLRNLRLVFRKLIKWKALREMPDIEMLEEIETEKPVFTEAEFEAMYKACETAQLALPDPIAFGRSLWWQALLVMYWETGMRRCEMLALKWSGVNLDRRLLTIDPADSKTRRLKEFSFGELGERHLRLLAAYGQSGAVFEWRHDVSRLNEALSKIKAEAGIDPARRHLAFHAIRRTVGEITTETYGLTAAQHKLGHSTPQITAKHYARAALRRQAQESTMPIPAGLRLVS